MGNTYEVKYKCRLCGTVFGDCRCGKTIADCAICVLGDRENFYPEGSGVGVHLHYPHYCKDGGIGLADFAGFVSVDAGKEE